VSIVRGCFSFSIALLIASTAIAQDTRNQRPDFFEKDFAKSPMTGSSKQPNRKPAVKPKSGDAQTETSPENLAEIQAEAERMQQEGMDRLMKDPQMKKFMGEAESRSDLSGKDAVKPASGTISEDGLPEPTRSLAVNSIGLIVNSMEREHYEAALQNLIRLADSRGLTLSTIYTLGNFEIATRSPLLPGLVARGAILRVLNEIPPGYEVTLSPSYIVKTPEGEVLLEAVSALEKYFSASGEFLDREPKRTLLPVRPPQAPASSATKATPGTPA
jgi:hypothetical protein